MYVYINIGTNVLNMQMYPHKKLWLCLWGECYLVSYYYFLNDVTIFYEGEKLHTEIRKSFLF